MIEVTVSSIKVSLMSQDRVLLLGGKDSEMYLPIWIGAFEAEAIRIALSEIPTPRPLTHDLLKSALDETGFSTDSVIIHTLEDEVFHALISISRGDEKYQLDARPSDAIAIAVRMNTPIFVDDEVMKKAAISPTPAIINEIFENEKPSTVNDNPETLGAFKDFLDSLDMDDFGQN